MAAGLTPPCRSPRPCARLTSCQLRCPHGFRLDDAGCETCECEDPCRNARCPLPWQRCRVFGAKCFKVGRSFLHHISSLTRRVLNLKAYYVSDSTERMLTLPGTLPPSASLRNQSMSTRPTGRRPTSRRTPRVWRRRLMPEWSLLQRRWSWLQRRRSLLSRQRSLETTCPKTSLSCPTFINCGGCFTSRPLSSGLCYQRGLSIRGVLLFQWMRFELLLAWWIEWSVDLSSRRIGWLIHFHSWRTICGGCKTGNLSRSDCGSWKSLL